MDANELATASPRRRNFRRVWLVAIVALAAAMRLGLFAAGPAWDLGRAAKPDTSRYVDLADSLRTRWVFGLANEGSHAASPVAPFHQLRIRRGESPPLIDGLIPEALRTPGYPAYLAAVQAVGLPLGAALALQCLMSAAVVLMAYVAANQLFRSRAAGLAAAAILAVHPGDVVGPNLLLTETLFGLLLLAGVVCVLSGLNRARLWPVWVGGLALGAATLVRPVGLLVAPALGLWLVLRRRDRWGAWAAAALVAAAMLPAGLWAARNARAGLGATLSNVATIHLAKTAAFMDMRADGAIRYPQDYYPRYQAVVDEVAAKIRDGETVDAATRRIVRARILARPGTYLGLLADSAAKFMLDHSAGDLYSLLGWEYRPTGLRDWLLGRGPAPASSGDAPGAGRDWPASAVAAAWTAWNAAMAGLLAWSLIAMALRRRWAALALLAGVLAYFIFATQYHGQERMRLPVLWAQAVAVGWVIARRRAANETVQNAQSQGAIAR
jgi:hypothetical protein